MILTVPLANRQRDIDRELDDLDRGVHLAALFFILLGAGDGAVDGRAHRRSGAAADPRHTAHRARRFRRADRGPVIRRTAPPRRCLQQHGGGAQGAAHPARTDAPARSVGGDGAAGRARNQEPADADSAVSRASAPRARRPRRADGRSAGKLRHVDSRAGAAAAADLRRVLQLCVSPDREASRRSMWRNSSPTSSILTGPVSPVGSRSSTTSAPRSPACSSTARSSPAAWRTSSRTHCTRCRARDRSVVDGIGGRSIRLDRGSRHRRRHGRGGACARVRALFSTKTTGTGLGLPIARRNIELNGGTIEIESTRGRGTLVRIRLPLAVGYTAAAG